MSQFSIVLAAAAATIAQSQLPSDRRRRAALSVAAVTINLRRTPEGCVDRTLRRRRADASLAGMHVDRHAIRRGTDRLSARHRRQSRQLDRRRSSGCCVAGFDVIAYDSRAARCDRRASAARTDISRSSDLQTRARSSSASSDVILIGHSLGGAVALQAAAIDRRIRAVVAASTFSDLRIDRDGTAPFSFHARRRSRPRSTRAEHDGRIRG